IHQLEAYIAGSAGPRDGTSTEELSNEGPRPRIVSSGDDATRRHFERLELYEMELQAAEAGSIEKEQLISELKQALDRQREVTAERLGEIERLANECRIQSEAAEQRLAQIEFLEGEMERQARASLGRAGELETTIEALAVDRDLQVAAAAERLGVIAELEREVEVQRQAAKQRLDSLESEVERQTVPLRERVALLEAATEALSAERDLQAAAAAERLGVIAELEREVAVQRQAAEERLASLEALGAKQRTAGRNS
ncbi:MAG: hypothetical protein QOH95_2008, partial [Gaiellaceae bacterium]|nr:hypothetical protein [Gaiellaceae bacterium]